MCSSVSIENDVPSDFASDKIVKLPSIKDFTIVKPISRGAFGKVFLCHKNENPDKMFAVKVMKKQVMVNKNMMKQVLTERDALAISRSPFVVQLFYSMQSINSIYLVMEYMIGGDVKSLLSIYGFFDEEMAVFYTVEAAHALEYLHQHNIVHRDLKPDNMLISSTGHIKLTDFGLSKITINRPIKLTDLIDSPSCLISNAKEGLSNRTPGQLLSLTSTIGFSCKNNKLNDSGAGSPALEGSAIHCHSSVSDSVNAGHFKLSEDDKNIEKSIVAPLALTFETPDKVLKSHSENTSYGSYYREKCLKKDSFSSISSHSSNYTPYCPKQKRKVLHGRPAKNFRKMKSQSSFTSPDFTSSKRKKVSFRKLNSGQSLDSGLEQVGIKRKCSFSPEEFRSAKRSTGLSTVLSELNFNSESDILDGVETNQRNLTPEKNENVTDDSVFIEDLENFFAPDFHTDAVNSQPQSRNPSKSSVNELIKQPQKSVNFYFESVSSRISCADNSVLHSSLNSSCNSGRNNFQFNSMFSTPTERKVQTKRLWTPHQTTQTPFRTPKSVRRGPEPASNERILGTPDYLAPELLLHMEHSFPVDWWALGVCLFEFLTGIPPFNDTTPDAVFTNILNRDIPWPEDDEALSEAARQVIDMLLTTEPNLRPGVKELKTWPLFKSIEWENILHTEAPFIPVPDSNTDTTYFDARNEAQHIRVSSFDM